MGYGECCSCRSGSICGKISFMDTDFLSSGGLVLTGCAAAFVLATCLSKNTPVKQFISRFAVNVRADCSLDESVYHEFRGLDIYRDGQHEQIDYVYVSCFGIFVVATPNYQGRIWGDDGNGMWTQKFHKSKTLFPNPLLKNQQYIRILSEKLHLPTRASSSGVGFPGNCQFQTMMPDNVTEDSDFAEYISQYTEVVLMPEEVKQIREVLEGYEFDLVFNRQRFESHV